MPIGTNNWDVETLQEAIKNILPVSPILFPQESEFLCHPRLQIEKARVQQQHSRTVALGLPNVRPYQRLHIKVFVSFHVWYTFRHLVTAVLNEK